MLKNPNTVVIVIDLEREYSSLINALGKEVIKISFTSNNHINNTDLNSKYKDCTNPVILKSEFILSLCKQLIKTNNLVLNQKKYN